MYVGLVTKMIYIKSEICMQLMGKLWNMEEEESKLCGQISYEKSAILPIYCIK